jgi:hypothetical protein
VERETPALAVKKEGAPGSLAAPSGGRCGSLPMVTRPGDGFQQRCGVEQQHRARSVQCEMGKGKISPFASPRG